MSSITPLSAILWFWHKAFGSVLGPDNGFAWALAVVFLVPVKRAVVSMAPAKKSSREIREWAIGAGHEVSSRGRISVEIERAFHDAQLEMPVA